MTVYLQSAIQELAAQPRTEQPFLSIYLDWSVNGNGQRDALQTLDQELERHAADLPERGPERESFDADRERITQYVQNEAPDDAQGLAIFACNGAGVWGTMAFQAPVENEVIVDQYPHIFNLVRLVDDYEPYAVVLAEGQEARILLVTLNAAEQAGETEASERIKRFVQGGQAQMLFQRRTENLVKAHMRDMAGELGQIMQRHGVERVVISCNDSIKNALTSTLPDQIKEKVVDYINIDISASDLKTILETVDPIIQQAERQQEEQEVSRLEDRVATKGGMGMVGIADIATALSKGQVMSLIISRNFSGEGGECANCGTLRPGRRASCPYDGTELQPVDLREAFVSRALQQSATVQVVEQSAFLDQHEGVGAILRYRDDTPEERTA